VLAEHAVDGGAGDAIALGQLAETLTALPVPQDGSSIKLQWLTPDVPALEPGAAHASPHPLDDQVALELRNRSDVDHDCPAQWPAGIDLLAEAE